MFGGKPVRGIGIAVAQGIKDGPQFDQRCFQRSGSDSDRPRSSMVVARSAKWRATAASRTARTSVVPRASSADILATMGSLCGIT